MESKRIVVVGATGKQGGALIRALSPPTAPAFYVYALTHNASSPAAQRLRFKRNVSVIEGDVNKPSTIFAAIPGPVYGVFASRAWIRLNLDISKKIKLYLSSTPRFNTVCITSLSHRPTVVVQVS
jgi:hypothetical protein